MVLDEAKQLLLVGKISREMKPNTLRGAMLQAVVEPLVLTEIKCLLMQFALKIPVRLGHKDEVLMRFPGRPDHVNPVLRGWPLARTATPCAFEDLVQ